MADAESDSEKPPRIVLTQRSTKRSEKEGRWCIRWAVENRSEDSVALHSARLPHGQFKADERRFEPALVLPPGKSGEFTVLVCCHGPPGWVIENAFVIFYATWSGHHRRIFARIRVTVSEDGRPQTAVESITTQKVGFSGIDS